MERKGEKRLVFVSLPAAGRGPQEDHLVSLQSERSPPLGKGSIPVTFLVLLEFFSITTSTL